MRLGFQCRSLDFFIILMSLFLNRHLPVARRANRIGFNYTPSRMLHHLMVGTWTPPGAIFTFEFDDETLSLKLIKRTAIPEDEPISWMAFDVSFQFVCILEKTC
jgi:hypothetical protein